MLEGFGCGMKERDGDGMRTWKKDLFLYSVFVYI